MSWLLRDDDVLAAIEPRRPRWAADLQGAVLLKAPAMVQTLTCRASLDVAWCAEVEGDDGRTCLEVRRIACLAPRRMGRPQVGRGAIIAAGRGAFERWKLQVGDRLEVREV